MRARLYYYMVTVLTRCTVAVNQSVRREFWLTLAGCFVRACLFGFGHTSHHIHHQLVLVYIHIYMYLCIYMYSNERNYVHSPCMCVSVNYDYLYGPHSKFVNVVRCWLHRPVVEFDVHARDSGLRAPNSCYDTRPSQPTSFGAVGLHNNVHRSSGLRGGRATSSARTNH